MGNWDQSGRAAEIQWRLVEGNEKAEAERCWLTCPAGASAQCRALQPSARCPYATAHAANPPTTRAMIIATAAMDNEFHTASSGVASITLVGVVQAGVVRQREASIDPDARPNEDPKRGDERCQRTTDDADDHQPVPRRIDR